MSTRIQMKVRRIKSAQETLVGRVITEFDYVDVNGQDAPRLRLDNGTYLVIMCDDEGNGGGSIHFEAKDGTELHPPIGRFW